MPRRLRPPPLLPFFLLLRSLLPSVHSFLSFHVPAFSLHFPYPPFPFPPRLSTLLPSNFFSTPLALALCLRAIARKENRNIEVEPRECHLDDSCRFVHTYTYSLFLSLFISFSLSLREDTCRGCVVTSCGSGGFGIFAREPVESCSLIRGPLGLRMFEDDEVRFIR